MGNVCQNRIHCTEIKRVMKSLEGRVCKAFYTLTWANDNAVELNN